MLARANSCTACNNPDILETSWAWQLRPFMLRRLKAEVASDLPAKLERLQPGTYIMVDHCGTEDPEMRALGHFGYENMAADRAAVVEAWTSPKVLEVVKRRNIQLIGHADLPRLARQ